MPDLIEFEYNDVKKKIIQLHKVQNNSVYIVNNFLTNVENRHIQNLCKDRWYPQINKTNYKKQSNNTCIFNQPTDQNDPILHNIKYKVSELIHLPIKNIEYLQVMRSTKYKLYDLHTDAFKYSKDNKEILKNGNRTHTILIYLNTLSDQSDARTSFPALDIHIKPKKNRAIIWSTLLNNRINWNLLYSGHRIQTDEIELCLLVWFREKEWDITTN